jgi:methyltransferase family protein
VTTAQDDAALYLQPDWTSPLKPASRFRRRRLSRFLALVDEVLSRQPECHILDIGGTTAYWADVADLWRGRNLRFTLLNLAAEPTQDPRFTSLAGDARDLSGFGDHSVDVVHSNSVIEHVGRWGDMKRMAGEVARVGQHYFVQTPAFGFPVEPHFRVPFFHWLPEPVRLRLVMSRACGYYPRARSIDEAMHYIEDATILDERRFRRLFPDAKIERERIGPLTKSFVAVR